MKLDSYHFSFDPTGNQAVDRILHNIALAGELWHNTEGWTEDAATWVENDPLANGDCMRDCIQNAANDAARALSGAALAFHQSVPFCKSASDHQLKPTNGWALRVTLTGGENDHLQFPVAGVIVAFEQGATLGISQAVFHKLLDDGRLGAPVVVKNPTFTYS